MSALPGLTRHSQLLPPSPKSMVKNTCVAVSKLVQRSASSPVKETHGKIVFQIVSKPHSELVGWNQECIKMRVDVFGNRVVQD